MNIFIISTHGEMLDVALHLQDVEKHNVKMWIPDPREKKIGDGLIEKVDNWYDYLDGQWTFLIDGCERGRLQDYLRSRGIPVFGGSEQGDVLENDRQAGQQVFKRAGFYQPKSENFTSIDDAIQFVQSHMDTLWVLKQNGDAPKSINHAGHFADNADMLWHLESLKKRWNETQFGAFDCDLMEKVSGLEVAASAYFNGTDFLRNPEGKAVVFLNFEEKKECDGGLGETCGEMGTTFYVTTEDHPLAREILIRPELVGAWTEAGVRGIVDVNCIRTPKGMVALEFTNRPGVPSSSYEFCVATKDFGQVLDNCAKGLRTPIEVEYGWGMVMVVAAKPFPAQADMDEEATSLGERLWILKNGKPQGSFTGAQRRRIHLENFYRDDEGHHIVATKDGYLLTVTAHVGNVGGTRGIQLMREELIGYIEDNLYIAGMKYRTDIGKRVEEFALEMDINDQIVKPQPHARRREVSLLGY
jgi:hypothetical protein